MTVEEAQRRAREVVESFEDISVVELQDRIAAAILKACESERAALPAGKRQGEPIVDAVSPYRSDCS